MYDAAASRSIGRSELLGSDFSRESSADNEALERLKARNDLVFTDNVFQTETAGAQSPAQNDDKGDEEDVVAFRLFAPSTKQDEPVQQTIRLRSPTPSEVSQPLPIIVNRPRPDSYYFQGVLSERLAAEYATSALSGSQIYELSRSYVPGLACSWKIIKGFGAIDDATVPKSKAKHSRIGKQARLKRRQKTAEANAKRKKSLAEAADKELQQREKRARRNREKKFKKRARDKLKKSEATASAASAVGDGPVPGEMSDSASSSAGEM